MQRLEQRPPDAILLLFLIAQAVDITVPVLVLFTLVAYSASLAPVVPGPLRKDSDWRRITIISAAIALVRHIIALEARIPPDGNSGRNLSLPNVGSLISLMICTVMIVVAPCNRDWLLLPIACAFALTNLALAAFVFNEYITHLEATPGILMHIGLPLFSYAMLTITALCTLQSARINYQLKDKKLAFNQGTLPLMDIERKMFHITQIGVVLLTFALYTGLFHIHNLLSTENIDKIVLFIVTWFVYIILLRGHYHEG